MGFDPASLRQAIRGFPFTTGMPLALRLDHAFGLPAYTISPAGAKKFKARCFPLSEFSRTLPLIPQPVVNSGIDAALNNVYAGADCYASFPPLVATGKRPGEFDHPERPVFRVVEPRREDFVWREHAWLFL